MEHRDVIDLFDTHQQLADLLGLDRSTVSGMKIRNRIPAEYWLIICEAKPEIDIRELARHVAIRTE